MQGRELETADSLVRRLLPLMYALAAALAFLLLLVWVAMQCQTTLASFLNADTRWMTARSRAMTELLSYAETGNPTQYAEYERQVAVVRAFQSAREQVLSGRFDYAQVRATLQSGGATVVSPRNTIYVFAAFSRAPYLRDAVAAWRSVDPFVAEWQHIAGALRAAYANGRPTPAEIARERSQLVAIDKKMAQTNAHFSNAVIQAAVMAGRVLYAVIFLLAAIVIGLWLAMARRILARAHIDQLRLEQLALHDPLTGLTNRIEFERRCAVALTDIDVDRPDVAVLFVDLDGFKGVNDRYGHATGDALLRLVGGRILAQVRTGDVVSRVGGDEFTVLLTGRVDRVGAAHFAERLSAALAQPFHVDGYDLTLGSSIGVALPNAGSTSTAALLAHADAAMYLAKQSKPNGWRFYKANMADAVARDAELAAGLQQALTSGQLHLAYQPIVAMRSGTILAAEALLRWERPGRGELAAHEFLAAAESAGLMTRIDNWVLHAACAQICAWDTAGVPPMRVAVNVSAERLSARGLVDLVREALTANHVAPARLVLEIAERTLLRRGGEVARCLRELHSLGVGIAIDNFGFTYASLSHTRLPGTVFVKVDRALVANLGSSGGAEDAAIAGVVLAMARGLGSHVIAEGVENETQRDRLLQSGCTVGQGLLYAPALPPADLAARLRAEPVGASVSSDRPLG